MTATLTRRERASALCLQNGQILCLRYRQHDGSEFWGVPGGAIEPGESPLQAALRETEEETGYRVEPLCDAGPVCEYDFIWQGRTHHCRTHWFGVRPIPGARHCPRPGDEPYLTALQWLPVRRWRDILPGNPAINNAIEDLLQRLGAL